MQEPVGPAVTSGCCIVVIYYCCLFRIIITGIWSCDYFHLLSKFSMFIEQLQYVYFVV